MSSDADRLCVICGESCNGQPRLKDNSGRYYHEQCYAKAQREQWRRQQEISESASAASAVDVPVEFKSAAEGNQDMMSFLMTESGRSATRMVTPETTAAAEHGCPHCGTYAAPGAAICTRCGRHLSEGGHVSTRIQRARDSGRERIDPAWRTFDHLAQCFMVGLSVVFLGLFAGAFFRPDVFLVVLLSLVVGALVLWQVCAVMLGFNLNIRTGLLVALVPFYSLLFLMDKMNHTMRMGAWTTAIGLALLLSSGAYVLWDEDARSTLLNGVAETQTDEAPPRHASLD